MAVALETQTRQFLRYAKSLFAFCQEVLGYHDLTSEHEALCAFLQQAGGKKLILMPRYSFKSSLSTIGYSLWRLTRNDSARILIYSDATSKAEGFLTAIKNHITGLESSSKFREIYGPWEVDPKRGVWNQSAIVIRPRQHAHAEPSIDTAGIETSKVGTHYDLIIFDDIVSDVNTTTKEQMDKVVECYRKALSLLRPGGEVVVVGTRWHFGDLYGTLLADPANGFATHIRQAEVHGTYPFASIGLTPQFLQQQRRDQGSYLHSCLYQNSPVDDESATFKLQDFAFYQPEQLPKGLYITCCLDPIPPHEGTQGDDAALTVCGTDHELNLYLLDIVAGRLQPSEQIEALFHLHQKWTLNAFGVETNAFQKVMRRDIELRYRAERAKNPKFRFFHIEEFVGTSLPNKELRIRGLQPYHERGALRFPGTSVETLTGRFKDLAWQLLQFPKATKDDLADSLAGHIPIHRAGTLRDTPKEYPYSSAAWYEREIWYKQQVKSIQREPRWNRPPVPQLSLS